MNKLFYKDKPIIGIDISQTGIKVMSIDTAKWSVQGYGSLDLDPTKLQQSIDGDGEFLASSLKDLLEKKIVGKIKATHAVLGIPTARTYSRTISLPKDLNGPIEDAINIEVEQYVPVPISQLHIDYAVTSKTDDSINTLMSAVPSRIVDVCIKAIESTGVQVVMAEPGMNAVARLIQSTEDGHFPTIIVDIGAASTDVAILDGSIKVTGGVPVGGNTFTLDISNKLKVSLENAHQLKVLNGLSAGPKQVKIEGALDPSLKRIVAEVKKIARYYSERVHGAEKLEQVIIVGGGSNIPGLGDYFTDNLVMAARVASPWQLLNFGKLPQPARQFKPRYITVAGLASVNPKDIWS